MTDKVASAAFDTYRAAAHPLSSGDREIITALIDSKAINFEALGRTIASVGAKAALMDDDGWIRFCGNDMRIFRWPRPHLGLEDIGILRDIVRGPVGR